MADPRNSSNSRVRKLEDGTRAESKVAGLEGHSTYQTLYTMQTQLTEKRKRFAFLRRKGAKKSTGEAQRLRFSYNFDELTVGGSNSKSGATTLTAVVLIHPIGVGIGRWYYDRLMYALHLQYGSSDRRYVFLSPDLLGSGSACDPNNDDGNSLDKLPLLKVSDWSNQLHDLMADYEAMCIIDGLQIDNWCLVANGGCSPIALQLAQRAVESNAGFQGKVTNVILSAPPRLPFFTRSSEPAKVKKSYRTLCGLIGKLFWWYALRKDGAFVQKFSEKNLVGHPDNLGDDWTPNCVRTAQLHEGRSRYSTFSFLAGTLQDGCNESLRALNDSGVRIDFIRGRDKRRNRAKSVFWQRSKNDGDLTKEDTEVQLLDSNVLSEESVVSNDSIEDRNGAPNEDTIQQFVQRNGNGGSESFVGGRISLAHEDASGYADALVELIGK